MSSPLPNPPGSALSSPPDSTPFHTAHNSPSEMSPTSSPKSETTVTPARDSQFRRALPIPYELREHVKIFFEESLYNHALQLLKQLLVSGPSSAKATNDDTPAFVPPPSHLELISTILIHPLHTTRAASHERREASTQALDYLRALLCAVGPVNSNLGRAFRFAQTAGVESRRVLKNAKRKGRHAVEEEESEDDEEEEEAGIRHALAREGSVWRQARDFWHVVGWAFNCSVRQRKRWDFYQVWLDLVVTAMEVDLRERVFCRDYEGNHRPVEASIVGRFLIEQGGRQPWKRAIMAVFADGMEASLRTFPEVWKDETREKKSDGDGKDMKTDRKVDIEKEDYGDYMRNEDDWDDEEPAIDHIDQDEGDSITVVVPTKPRYDENYLNYISLGGVEAVELRIRLISLLINLCGEAPNSCLPVTLVDLFKMLTNHICSLDYNHFTHIIHIQALHTLAIEAFSSLAQMIVSRLIDHKAPANADASDAYDQSVLEECYLPFAANTSSAEDNAKLAWAVEALFRIYYVRFEDEIETTPGMEEAIERGTAARLQKCKADRRKKADTAKSREDDNLRKQIEESGERMKMIVEAIKEDKEKERERKKTAKKEWRRRQKEKKREEREREEIVRGISDGPDREALGRFWEEHGLPLGLGEAAE